MKNANKKIFKYSNFNKNFIKNLFESIKTKLLDINQSNYERL